MRCQFFEAALQQLDEHERLGHREHGSPGGREEPVDLDALERHAASCNAGCGETWKQWRQWRILAASVRSLPQQIEPERDLWSGIESGIGQRRDGKVLRPMDAKTLRRRSPLRAIALLAASLLFLLAVPPIVRRISTSAPHEVASRTTASEAETSQAADVARYEDHQVRQRRALLSASARKEAILNPELARSIQRDIEVLNDAIGEIRIAMANHPGDPRLDLMLADRYRQEARLLRALDRI